MNRSRWVLSSALAVSLMVLVATLSPGDLNAPMVAPFPHADKVVHVLLWALLATAWRFVLSRSSWNILLCAAFAIATEVGQAWVPGRSMDLWDMLADIAGAGCAIVFWNALAARGIGAKSGVRL